MKFIIYSGILSILLLMTSANAATTFYTDEAAWSAAVGDFEAFETTATNIASANEVVGIPVVDTDLGATTLTFNSINTGLSRSFTLTALNGSPEYDWVFGDSGFADGPDLLSTGAASLLGAGDDDWELSLTSGPQLFGFSFILGQNNVNQGDESFSVFSGANLLGTFTALPTGVGGVFLGVVSDQPITSIILNEGNESSPPDDDVYIADLRFASPVPLPAGFILFLSGLTFLSAYTVRRRRAYC